MVDLRLNLRPSEPTINETKLLANFGWINDKHVLNSPAKLSQTFKDWNSWHENDILTDDVVDGIYKIMSSLSSKVSKIDYFMTLTELLSYKSNYLTCLCAALLRRMIDNRLISSILTQITTCSGSSSTTYREKNQIDGFSERIIINRKARIDTVIFSRLISMNDRFLKATNASKWWKFDQREYNKKLVDELFVSFKKLEAYSFNNTKTQVNAYPLILFVESLVKTNQHENLFNSEYYKNLMMLQCEMRGSLQSKESEPFTFFQMKLYSMAVLNINNSHLQQKIISCMMEHFPAQVILKCFAYANLNLMDETRPLHYILFDKFMFETPFYRNDEKIGKLVKVIHKHMLNYNDDGDADFCKVESVFQSIFEDVCDRLSTDLKILQYTDDYVLYMCKLLLIVFKLRFSEKISTKIAQKHNVLSLMMKLSNAFLSAQNTPLKRDLGLFTVETMASKMELDSKSTLKFSFSHSLELDNLKHFYHSIVEENTQFSSTIDNNIETLDESINKININNINNDNNVKNDENRNNNIKNDNDNDPLPKKRTKEIRFLRDCLDALTDTSDRERHEKAISVLEKLIRRSPTETNSLSERMFKLLLNLNNELNIPDYDNLRIQSMVAVMAIDYEVIGRLGATLFYEENYSLSQRVELLTTISMAVQEIVGRKVATSKNLSYTENIPFYCFNEIRDDRKSLLYNPVNKVVDKIPVVHTNKKERISTVQMLFYLLADVKKAEQLHTLRLFNEDSFVLAQLLKTLNIIVSSSKNYNISVELCKELLQLCKNFFTHQNSQVRYMTLMSVVTVLDTLSSLPSSLQTLLPTIKSNHAEQCLTMSITDTDVNVRRMAEFCVLLLSNT